MQTTLTTHAYQQLQFFATKSSLATWKLHTIIVAIITFIDMVHVPPELNPGG
jgi:hypothetical protein